MPVELMLRQSFLALLLICGLTLSLLAEEQAQDLLLRAQAGDVEAQMEMAQRYLEGKGVPRSEQQVNWWLRQAADGGYLLAQLALANRYMHGMGIEVSESDALYWYREASKLGSGEAKYHVAMMGLKNNKVTDDAVIAELIASADLEYAPAAYQLGRLYALGQGFEQSYAQAQEWYLKSAALKYGPACFALGEIFDIGLGVVASPQLALYWYRRSAELDYAPAQATLGTWYMLGEHVPMSALEAGKWFRRAAYQENADACFALGVLYEEGRFVEGSKDVAKYWYLLAAKQGHPDAQCALGLMQVNADKLIEGVDQIAEAASAGNARAQVELGKVFELGLGRDESVTEAFVWYRQAADQSDAEGQYQLGRCYQEGIGVEADPALALNWFTEAARQQHSAAQRSIGLLYYYGQAGKDKDLETALHWMRLAAESADVQAQFYLGNILLEEKKYLEARHWFHHAAEKDYVAAQFELAELWELGKGTEANVSKALYWYQRAADAGHMDAAASIKRLRSSEE